jgi:hypothetical protein
VTTDLHGITISLHAVLTVYANCSRIFAQREQVLHHFLLWDGRGAPEKRKCSPVGHFRLPVSKGYATVTVCSLFIFRGRAKAHHYRPATIVDIQRQMWQSCHHYGGKVMALLQIRDFPQNLYERLNQMAKTEYRSIPQEAVSLIEQALEYRSNRQTVLEEYRLQRATAVRETQNQPITLATGAPPPEQLTREDRDR